MNLKSVELFIKLLFIKKIKFILLNIQRYSPLLMTILSTIFNTVSNAVYFLGSSMYLLAALPKLFDMNNSKKSLKHI